MSVQTLYTAATGMTALETKLDVIANNLANVNTTGFKRDRANFEDLFYRNEILPGALDSAGNLTSTGVSVGLGTALASVQTDFSQGAINQTNRNLDVAIFGKGFYQVTDPASGEVQYTRSGHFDRNANGDLVIASAGVSRVVQPPINIPNTAVDISVSPDGIVGYTEASSPSLNQAGQLQLATFINPDGLQKLGENLYSETDASSTAIVANPGQNGLGSLSQGQLEASNVEPVQELIDLITTQRSFELNSQAVQAGDQVLQIISNLRRF